jgi:hypothetical protein
MTSFSPPDPSSFVYTELVQTNRGGFAGNTTELWLSADGSKDSAAGQTVDMAQMIKQLKASNVPAQSLPDSMSGKHFFQSAIKRCVSPGHPESGECAPPGYVADAPTDAAGMRAYLFPVRDGKRVGKREAWTRAFNLLPPRLLAPAAKTALFETLAGIPGLTVQHDVTLTALPDRRGVAVVAPTLTDGLSMSLVFDADSHGYIGCRLITTRALSARNGQPAIPAGAEVASQTVLRSAVVADAGLRPDGTRPQAVSPSQTMGNASDVIAYEMFTPWTAELASAFAGEATPGAS